MHLPLDGLIGKIITLQCTMQVTAYSVIGENGQTGTLPTGVNFQVGSSSYGTTTDGKSAYMGASSQVSPIAHQHCLRPLGASPRLLIKHRAILRCISLTKNRRVGDRH